MEPLTVIACALDECGGPGRLPGAIPSGVPLIVVARDARSAPAIAVTQRPATTLIVAPDATPAQAHQLAADAAETTWLVYCRAGATFAPDYFGQLKDLLRFGAKYGALYGAVCGQPGYYRWLARGQQVCDWLGIPAGSGDNLVLRRDALRAVGGFDRTLAWHDASDVLFRMQRFGYPIAYAPALIVNQLDGAQTAAAGWRRAARGVLRCGLLYVNLLPSGWRTPAAEAATGGNA